MITDFLRDQAWAVAWLALMAAGWFGWAQEDPKPGLRRWLGAGSVLGLLVTIAFGLLVARNWSSPTALDGRYWVFGVVVAAEVLLIGGGCIVLARRGQKRWYGWWIGLCVAVHFVPLVWVFADWSYLVLALVQVAGLLLMVPLLRRGEYPTSRWACPWIAATFLLFAITSAVVLLAEYGYPL
ncbi:hypothetical protein DFO66_107138 [Brevibacterium sanguinis]|uniref:Uncharacterized protein n=2 Tax=Brevibacterium TaxID=1696 RepID=A0A366IIJ8_9MICO|nr:MULTISPECIES: hypothetical protein [Brevibacterium]RBP64261.1 hypothetical protein DFO66_107138 [Brevibacterium sanguinis]RBP71447.1 hypothetical protein DFO65_10546 [Brevibacterium celere]